ncbi:hypothetical protein [Aliamphritea hakodatensis]|uniref:hypothetical protein n=1 Tax=Aliamphritea hakodatensis TaxID=2895352 RepID=UPI0022FD71F4|nr:hypothetical protein [Aliamphritea hakodatensis]
MKEKFGHSGPQKELIRSILKPNIMLALILIFTISLIYQIGYEYGFFCNSFVLPFSLDKTITVYVLLLGTVFAVRNFCLSSKPLINYEYRSNVKSESGLSDKVFQTKLKNSGNGIAIINSVLYIVKTVDSEEVLKTEEPFKVIEYLEKNGIHHHKDLEILFCSPGYALGSNAEKPLLESAQDVAEKIEFLDMRIRVKSIMNNEFEKWVFCIPRNKDVSFYMRIRS